MKRKLKIITSVLVLSLVMSTNVIGATLSATDVDLNIGDVTKVTVFEDTEGYWVSDKPNVATVEDGVIRGLSVGDAVISFIESDNTKNDVKVKVIDTKAIQKFDKYIISESPSKENEIKPGKYVIMAEHGKFGTYTISKIDKDIGYMQSSNILTNVIVDLEDGCSLDVENCVIYPLESIKLNTSSSGSFIVGQHIPAGTYVIETNNCDIGQYILYKNTDKSEILEAYHIKQNTPYEVKLNEGEYIELDGLKLVG